MRRINYERRTQYPSSPPLNPYEWIESPEIHRPFRLCFHTQGLVDVPPDERLALWQAIHLRTTEFAQFQTPGEPTGLSFRRVEIVEHATDDVVAAHWTPDDVPTESPDRAIGYMGSLRNAEQLSQMYGTHSREIQKLLLDAWVPAAIEADLLITTDPRLLAMRDRLRLAEVVTPREALTIIGPWSRGVHRAFLGLFGLNPGLYWAAVTRAVVPHVHPLWGAIVGGERLSHGTSPLMPLGQSINTRLAGMIRRLDRMAALWQLPTNNDRLDELADQFDSCVLEANAVMDTMARLVGTSLGISLGGETEWGLLRKPWRRAVSQSGPAGRAIADYVLSRRPHIELSLQFRHHAVHRERLKVIRVRKQADPEVSRIRVDGPLLEWVMLRLEQMSEAPTAWGLGDIHRRARVHVSSTGRTGVIEYEVDEPEWSELDPMPFASRLVATTAATVDELARMLYLADEATHDRQREDVMSEPTFPFREIDGQLAILLGPMSGLVPVATPSADEWTAAGARAG